MRKRNYLYLAITIFLAAVLINTGLHWNEVWAMISEAGTEILMACLNIALTIGGIILILSPIYHK